MPLVLLLVPGSGTSLASQDRQQVRTSTAMDSDRNKVFDGLDRSMAGAGRDTAFDVIVVFDHDVGQAELSGLEDEVGEIDVTYRYRLLPAIAASVTARQIGQLSKRADVVQIQRDAKMHTTMNTARADFGVDAVVTDLGVDGGDGSPAYSTSDIVAAVVDTGISTTHVDLDEGKVIGFVNCTSGSCLSASPIDDNGHGTHVSSILAGSGDADSNFRGVAPGAALLGVKVLDSGGFGNVSWVDKGIEWVIANKATYGIDVLNLSLGSDDASDGTDSTSRLVNKAVAAGISTFVAAGNDGPGAGTIGSPGAAKFPVTVGAMSNPADMEGSYPPGFTLARFSSRGPTLDGRTKPDIAAPGADIRAALAGTTGSYLTISGTSMATPFAAGVAALMLDADPSLAPSGSACPGTTPADCLDGVVDSSMDYPLKEQMMGTAIDWGPQGQDDEYGAGRLDAYRAVALTQGPPAPNHAFIAGNLTGTGDLIDCELDVTDTQWPIAVTTIMPDWVSASNPDIDIRLFDPSSNSVASSLGVIRQETLGYRPLVTGTFTLRIFSAEGSGDFWTDVSFGGTVQTAGCIDLSISDVTVEEGDVGSTSAVFDVSLSGPLEQTVTVTYATSDGTATQPDDYGAESGILTFPPGSTSQAVTVTVVADALDEVDEFMFVDLSDSLVAIGDGQATGTIVDDDPDPRRYAAVTPARILDTRDGSGVCTPTCSGAMPPNTTRTIQVTGQGGIPASGVAAVAMNVTVTEPTGSGFLTIYPSDASRPTASNLNFTPGATVPNMVKVKLGPDGRVALYNSFGGNSHVLFDVAGWYSDGSVPVSDGAYIPLSPMRILDTRNGTGTGGSTIPIPSAGAIDVLVSSQGGVPSSTQWSAVALNATVTGPTSTGFLTIWPKGETKPVASNLNFVPGQTVPNLAIVKKGAGGMVSVYNGSGGTVHVVFDTQGWFTTASVGPSGAFTPLPPARILDTRELGSPISPGEAREVQVTGLGGIPGVSEVAAVAMNATVTQPAKSGYLTLYPLGDPLPTASNLNFVPNLTVANMVVVKMGNLGKISVYNGSPGTVHVVLDVAGWFSL